METSNLNRFKSILKRYKLANRTLGEDEIEIGGGHNIKYLKLYYFYLPLLIGSIIVLIGFLINFIFIAFCSAPFFIYTVYGIGQVNMAMNENRNTTIIGNGEIRISINDIVSVLNSQNIKDYKITTEALDDELHLSQFLIIDKENNEQILLTLIDHKTSILKDNMTFLKDFIQAKINITNTPLAQES